MWRLTMPYKNPKDRKKQPYPPKGTKEHEDRMERQRARRAMDKKGVDRKGKDVSHDKPLKKGGKNKDGIKMEDRSSNRRRNYKKTSKTPK
jgi:hypothetical protein